MSSGPVKVFRDPVHGYIEVPRDIVKKIIDTEQFQRLKFIEQTSMRALFPAARHDRFIHSLGTYWLGVKAFKGFRNNCKSVIDRLKASKSLNPDDFTFLNDNWWAKYELLFQIACLMHDCAHAPFSHTLEDYYDLIKEVYEGITCTKLSVLLCSRCLELKDDSFKEDFYNPAAVLKEVVSGVGKPHEQMSAYIILNEYIDPIADVCSCLLPEGVALDPQDYVFICRSIIGCHYSEESPECALKNCIISLLNSELIDVDGLDYIVRDAQMSGMSAYDIDYQRLLNSFTIAPVNVYKEENVQHGSIDGLWLRGSKFFAKKMFRCQISATVSLKTQDSNHNDILKDFFQSNAGSNAYSFELKTADGFARIDKVVPNIQLDLADTGRLTDTNFSGTITKGKRVIEKEEDIQKDKPLSFVLAYDKRCLSLIQNTINARNDEYLWVYSHPKVMYNAVYLQCALLKLSAKFLCCKCNKQDEDGKKLTFECKSCPYFNEGITEEQFITHILGYEFLLDSSNDEIIKQKLHDNGFYFFRTNDDDLNALFKRIQLENESLGEDKSLDISQLCEEYFCRKHKSVLWKSFIEYKAIYRMLDETCSQRNMEDLLDRYSKMIKKKNQKYIYLEGEDKDCFEEQGFNKALVIFGKANTKEISGTEFLVKYEDRVEQLFKLFSSNMIKEGVNLEPRFIYANTTESWNHQTIIQLNNSLGE